MPAAILLAFVAAPIVEIALLIQVGEAIGVWRTVGLILLMAAVGIALMRAQGMKTLQAAQASVNRNELPVAELFDGACLMIAGMLLVIPGFVTDAIGLLLFIPPVRRLVRMLLWRWLSSRQGTTIWVDGEVVHEAEPVEPVRPGAPEPGSGRTIEGDWRRIDDKTPRDDRSGSDSGDGGDAGDGRNGDDRGAGRSKWDRR